MKLELSILEETPDWTLVDVFIDGTDCGDLAVPTGTFTQLVEWLSCGKREHKFFVTKEEEPKSEQL